MSAEIRIGNETTGLLLQETLSEDLTAALPALVYDSSTGEVLYRDVSSSGGVTPTSNFMYWDSSTTSYIPYSTIQSSTDLSISSSSVVTNSTNNISKYLVINGGLVAGTTYSSNNYIGVAGYSNTNIGVRGQSSTNYGVYGTSTTGYGVGGNSINGSGVYGYTSGSGEGVRAASNSGYGLRAISTSNHGIYSTTTSGYGINAVSTTGYGVGGTTTSGIAGYFAKSGSLTTNNTSDTFSIVRSLTGTSYNNTGTLLKINDTSTSTTGTVSGKLIDAQIGNTSYFYIDPRGGTSLYLNTTGASYYLSRLYSSGVERVRVTAEGQINLYNSTSTTPGYYLLGTDTNDAASMFVTNIEFRKSNPNVYTRYGLGFIEFNDSVNGVYLNINAPVSVSGAYTMQASNGLSVSSGGPLMLQDAGGQLGFFGSAGSIRPTITGSRSGNAALASLLSALAVLGLITNSTT